jgi:hypothetical protein
MLYLLYVSRKPEPGRVMFKSHNHIISKAQTMLEYLLVMVVVVAIVLAALKNGQESVLAKTRNKAGEYFDSGAMGIMGGYYASDGTFVKVEPAPVNGDWCADACVNGYTVKECACPRPAFGGSPCSGEAVVNSNCK